MDAFEDFATYLFPLVTAITLVLRWRFAQYGLLYFSMRSLTNKRESSNAAVSTLLLSSIAVCVQAILSHLSAGSP